MAEVKMSQDPVADQLRQTYPSNSITAKVQPSLQKEKVQSVVKGKTVLQTQTLGDKLKKAFLPGDLKDIRNYAIQNVIIPNLKNGFLAVVELALFGNVRRRSGGFYNSNQNTNYSYISSNQRPSQPSMSQRDRAAHDFRNIIFETYQDAEDVVSTMLDLLDRYQAVTVANFYDLAHIDADWGSEDWGWTSFQRLEPRAVRGGYIIDINPPVLLRR